MFRRIPGPANGLPTAIAGLLTLVFLAVLLRTAWISDDAAITLRTVLNVTHGFGLTYNIAERVQTYTHPFWLGLLTAAYLAAGNVYAGTFTLAIVTSLSAFWLALTRAASPMQALAVAVVLVGSRAFVDFSTSGLENPLTCLLLAVFIGTFLAEDAGGPAWLRRLFLVGSLLYLTRPDTVLLVLPLLAAGCWRVRRPAAVAAAAVAGTLPAAAWTIFALIYYGFPFPNTAYAKLAMGIDAGELRAQGVVYLLDSFDRDPLTLTATVFALLLAVMERTTVARGLAVGVALYLVYVVSIGGDFMAGRFLSVPLYAGCLILGRLVHKPRPVWAGATAIFVVVGSMAMHVPLWSNSRFDDSAGSPTGIVDERGIYFKDASLMRARRSTYRNPDWPSARWRPPAVPQVLDTCGLMGTAGIEFGPYVHLLDECALADPLLSRMPALYNPDWRSGHYRRMIPAGYRETLEGRENVIEDPGLREFYDHLRTITRSPALLSANRLRAIAAMNAGRYDHLIDRAFFRHGGARVPLEDVGYLRRDGSGRNDASPRVLERPLAVVCDDRAGRRYLDVSVDSDDRYRLTFLKRGVVVSTLEVAPVPEYRREPGVASHTLDLPAGARARGFDTVVVAPIAGDDRYAFGHLVLEGHAATDRELHRRVAVRDGMAVR